MRNNHPIIDHLKNLNFKGKQRRFLVIGSTLMVKKKKLLCKGNFLKQMYIFNKKRYHMLLIIKNWHYMLLIIETSILYF